MVAFPARGICILPMAEIASLPSRRSCRRRKRMAHMAVYYLTSDGFKNDEKSLREIRASAWCAKVQMLCKFTIANTIL